MNNYLTAMRSYAVFGGRASREQFWHFTNGCFILALVAVVVDASLGTATVGVFTQLVFLVHALPSFAITARRMHDLDRTGWWALIGLTVVGGIVLLFMANGTGTPGANRFGPPPAGTAPSRAGLPATGIDLAQSAPQTPRDPIAEVERLAQLRSNGSLTETEFEVMKAQALSRRLGV